MGAHFACLSSSSPALASLSGWPFEPLLSVALCINFYDYLGSSVEGDSFSCVRWNVSVFSHTTEKKPPPPPTAPHTVLSVPPQTLGDGGEKNQLMTASFGDPTTGGLLSAYSIHWRTSKKRWEKRRKKESTASRHHKLDSFILCVIRVSFSPHSMYTIDCTLAALFFCGEVPDWICENSAAHRLV